MSNTFLKQIVAAGVGLVLCVSGIDTWHTEAHRTVTPETVVGTIDNIHTVSATRNETLHFVIVADNGQLTRDLYTQEPLMFMKARNGQRVEATFTQETGYVSKLSIVSGAAAGFEYDEPDKRNTFGGIAMFLFGFALIASISFQWFTSSQAKSDEFSRQV